MKFIVKSTCTNNGQDIREKIRAEDQIVKKICEAIASATVKVEGKWRIRHGAHCGVSFKVGLTRDNQLTNEQN